MSGRIENIVTSTVDYTLSNKYASKHLNAQPQHGDDGGAICFPNGQKIESDAHSISNVDRRVGKYQTGEPMGQQKKKRHASLAGPSFLFFGAKICTRVSGVGRSLLADHLSHISQRHFVWSHTAVITLNVQVIISPMQHWKAAIRNTLTEKEEGIRAHRPSAGID